MIGISTVQQPPPSSQPEQFGVLPSSSLSSSSSSSSPDSPSTAQIETIDSVIGGFQWLKVTEAWGEDETGTSSPLMDRSSHSHGSLGTYALGVDRSNHYNNSRDPHNSAGQLSFSPGTMGMDDNEKQKIRSRSVSPTSSTSFVRGRRQRAPLSAGLTGSSNHNNNNSSSSSHGQSTNSNKSDYELKNARDALVGSISAVINFLRSAGVPKPSTDQLQRNLEMSRYFAVLKRSMDYIQCVESESQDDLLAKVHLAVNAWEALCRLKALEYKRAYKYAFRLRYDTDSAVASPSEIKQAIEVQIKIAEQCTACQKKLYLVHKWQRRVLQRTKKAATIEPQGYQAIPCL